MVMTLAAYRLAWNNHLSAPVPLNPFIQYGHWFQQQAVPDIDPRKVTRVEDDSAGFRVTLEDGEVWKSRRVIVAAGIAAFAWRPSEFAGLPAALVSHTSGHRVLGRLAVLHGLLFGGAQGALEGAAL